jgi:hypothetical protein
MFGLGKERSAMSSDLSLPSTTHDDSLTRTTVPEAMTPAEKTAAVTRVRCLEHDMFDDDGHVRRGVDRSRAEEALAEINGARRALGWLEIDLEHRWRWPASTRHAAK